MGQGLCYLCKGQQLQGLVDISEEGLYCADISHPHGRTSALHNPEGLSLSAVSTRDMAHMVPIDEAPLLNGA